MQTNDEPNEKERTNVYLDVGAKEALQERPSASLSEAARRGVRAEAYGEQVVEAEEKNDVAREQREQTLSEIDEAMARVKDDEANAFTEEEVLDTLETLRESIDDNVERQIHARQQQTKEATPTRGNELLEEWLAELDSILSRGENVYPGHGKVEKAVEVSGVSGPEEIIDLLKERNPDVPESQFELTLHTSPDYASVDSEGPARTDGGERR